MAKKITMPDDYAERARIVKKHNKDGWCVWCEQPVTVGEYKSSHWGGKCLSVNPSPLGDGDSKVTKAAPKADLRSAAARYERLARNVSDQALARAYYAKAREIRKQLANGAN